MEKYIYDAHVTGVYDGDTITCDVDLGFGVILKKQKFRLWGIDTWELRSPETDKGRIARDFVRARILNRDVLIRTHRDKKGKYGRWLCEVFYKENDNQINLNELLVSEGHAKEFMRDT